MGEIIKWHINKDFPLEIVDLDPELAGDLMNYFTGEHTGFVKVGPKGYFLPHKYREEAANIYNMPLRASDVFVSSYPRSGTTWTQELVWLVVNDLNYKKAAEIPLTERYPFLEFSTNVHPVMKKRFYEENIDSKSRLELLEAVTAPGTQQLAEAPSPRFIKTHLPVSLLPPALLDVCKMVYVARDPRDVAVSFYHLNRSIRTQGYIDHWTPYFEHLKEAWNQRDNPNMLFLFYEELAKDLPAAVKRVTQFFGKQYSQTQVEELCQHLSIDSFKSNKSVNYDVMRELGITISGEQAFIRQGKAGGWHNYFDEEMSAQAQQWIAHNLKDTDLKYPHMQDGPADSSVI